MFKADVFSLGLTLLEAGTLSTLDDIYSDDTNKYRKESIMEKISIMNKVYSKDLGTILQNMLKLNSEARTNIHEVDLKL